MVLKINIDEWIDKEEDSGEIACCRSIGDSIRGNSDRALGDSDTRAPVTERLARVEPKCGHSSHTPQPPRRCESSR
jgi:hypothetical protein